MDYKAYKEALERAKNIYGASESKDILCTLKTIFPELKEIEDERTRKALIELVGMVDKNPIGQIFGYGDIKYSDMIAWLEKQGVKDSQVKLPTFTFDDILALQCCMEIVKKVQEDKDLYEKLNDLHGRVYDAYHLEKQGEQNHYGQMEKCINCQFNYTGYCNGTCILKNKKQKPADNVEPKFHEGQWIVWKDKYYKVNYNGCRYELIGQDGLSTSLGYGDIDKSAHVFTIQSAKDGDVLATENGRPFIFKGLSDKFHPQSPVAYCGIDSDDEFFIPFGIDWWTEDEVYPATKEQRERLEKAITNAGYEWDAEEKELKKIAETNKEEKWYDFIRWFVDKRTKQHTLIPSDNDIHKWGDLILSRAKDVLRYEQGWTEEDESMRTRCIGVLGKCYMGELPTKVEEELNWLKSLRPQNNISDKELIKARNEAYNDAIDKLGYHRDAPTFNDGWSAAIKYFKNRNILQSQTTWKPSDEQIKALTEALSLAKNCGEEYSFDLSTLLDTLKKLKGEQL